MPNRLAKSSSPYLRQHADNPVDWYPWCEEAFEKARTNNLPIFLSVGYAACHWCHVMEHESFENEDIATILNQNFVSIKVDREERPDVDQVYMQAVQMMTGSGGWPMSVFMNGAGEPFYAGTYWPPTPKHQRPGFDQVLLAVLDAWNNKSKQLAEQSEQVVGHLQQLCRGPAATSGELDPGWIDKAVKWLIDNHDRKHGGFGGAPKFPHAMDLSLMLEFCSKHENEQATAVVTHTLNKMFLGGIYDHLGGGFARYSVDVQWLVPHFEKMLYDNALLTVAYAEAYRQTSDRTYLNVVVQTLDYVIRDMTHPEGGFFSTEDADSEGVEGKFYAWTPTEAIQILGPDFGSRFCEIYDVTESGNFEGKSILNLRLPLTEYAQKNQLDLTNLEAELAQSRRKLFEARNKRTRPGLDDKVLLSWNALMITAMCQGYRISNNTRYKDTAIGAFSFVLKHLRRQDGRFWHSWREGVASIEAFLDDISYLLDALCELYQIEAHPKYLELAVEVAENLKQRFTDPDGGFFYTADDQEKLIARSKDLADSSVPSGNAMAALSLLKLAQLTGEKTWREVAEGCLKAASGILAQSPQAAGQSLRALMRLSSPSKEYVLVMPEGLADEVADQYRFKVFAMAEPYSLTIVATDQDSNSSQLEGASPLLENRLGVTEPTLFICENHTCQAPIVGTQILKLN